MFIEKRGEYNVAEMVSRWWYWWAEGGNRCRLAAWMVGDALVIIVGGGVALRFRDNDRDLLWRPLE